VKALHPAGRLPARDDGDLDELKASRAFSCAARQQRLRSG
jgi:hypothetical protein